MTMSYLSKEKTLKMSVFSFWLLLSAGMQFRNSTIGDFD